MTFIALMATLFFGYPILRSIVMATARSTNRSTKSEGCGCLAAIFVLALVTLIVAFLSG